MRILYFTRDYTPHDHRFLAALAETDHEVHYLRLERRGHQQEDRILPPGVKKVNWAGGGKPFRVRDIPRLIFSLWGVLRQVKPDVLHAGPIQTAGLLATMSGFHPLVTMSWGSDLLRDADKNSWYRWATRYTLKRSDVLIGDCDAVRQKAMGFGFPEKRIVTFPWGVDLQQFSPGADDGHRARAGWEDAFVLLHLRSWEPIYGVDVFARAFALAAKQRPGLRLFLLGNGSLAGEIRQIYPRWCDGECAFQRSSEECRPAQLLPGGRPVRERFTQRWLFGLFDGSLGLWAACTGIGYPGEPRVGPAWRAGLAFP
jgi:glycosyltransferase involved in cell wall biosynthesis